MSKAKPQGGRARTRARRLALQGLYQWQISGATAADIAAQLSATQNTKDTDTEYFEELLRKTVAANEMLAEAFAPHLDRPAQQLDPIERGILLLGTYELKERLDVPYRVVINEAIESAKRFGSDQGHTYVNGVLDKAAAQWRAVEVGASRSR